MGNILDKADIEDCHFRCLCHILNLGVQDMLKILNYGSIEKADLHAHFIEKDEQNSGISLNDMEQVISKVRNLFKKIRSSEQLRKTLELICVNVAKIDYVEQFWMCQNVGIQLLPCLLQL